MALTLMPGRYIDHSDFINIPNFDKLVHMVLFLVFAVLFYGTLASDIFSGRYRYLPLLITLLTSIGYGVLIEFFQRYVPGRDPDIYDAFADSAGALFGIVIILIKKNISHG
jgi:VanZ family protein